MDKIPLEVLAARLDKWERERRQLVALVVLALTVCVGLSLQANVWGRRSRTLEAENFVVRDRSGTVRAQMALNGDGVPQLSLFDRRGREQFAVRGAADDSASLCLYDHGQLRMSMATASGGAASLHLYDRNHDSATGLYMADDSTTGLTFRNGSQELHLSVQPDGQAGVRVLDDEGREISRLGTYTPLTPSALPRTVDVPRPQQTDVSEAVSSADTDPAAPALTSAVDRRRFSRPTHLE